VLSRHADGPRARLSKLILLHFSAGTIGLLTHAYAKE